MPLVPARRRAIDAGSARGRESVLYVARELRDGIRNQGLSYTAVGRDIGLSAVQVSRVARGRAPELTILQASELLASIGQELSIRAYPTGRPLRDGPQLALLARLRDRVHPSITWRAEVPITGPPDLRAWDAVLSTHSWRRPVEAESRLADFQAVERRLALKQRDGQMTHVILLVANTRHNRTVLHSLGEAVLSQFPVPGRRALELLAAGVAPDSSTIILL